MKDVEEVNQAWMFTKETIYELFIIPLCSKNLIILSWMIVSINLQTINLRLTFI